MEGLLEALLDHASEALIAVAPDGEVTYWTDGAARLLGISRDEALGRPFESLVPAERRALHHAALELAGRGEVASLVTEWRRRDGTAIDVAVSMRALRDAGGAPRFVAVAVRDRAEGGELQEAREAKNRFQRVVEAAPDAMIIVDREGRMVLVNAQAEREFGYHRNELLGQPVEMLMPERFRENHVRLRGGFFSAPRVRAMASGLELRGLRKDGSEFPAEISLSPMETPDGTLVSSAIRDVTERRRAEADLSATAARHARLWERVLAAQEDERRRLARELHDHAGSSLAAMLLTCHALCDSVSLAEARATAGRLADELRATMDDLTRLARGLHPVALDELGLAPALERGLATIAQRAGLVVEVGVDLAGRRLPSVIETALYRVAQEAMTNVIRHAHASHVSVRCYFEGDVIVLEVKDDGRGFDPEAAEAFVLAGRIGLAGIRDRIALLGGSTSIVSRPHGGTCVDVRIPLPAAHTPLGHDEGAEPGPTFG